MASKRRLAPKRFRRARKSKLGLCTVLILLLLLAGYAAVLELSRPHVTGDPLRFDVLSDLIEKGRIKSAEILDEDAYVLGSYVRDDGSLGQYNAPLIRGAQGQLVSLLTGNKIPTTINQQPDKRVAGLALFSIPMMMLIVIFGYFIVSSRRGTGLFAIGHGARKSEASIGDVTFADVAGQEDAIKEIKEIKEFLSDPQRFADVGAEVPRGVLLFGPPGCGKTLLARALAGEAGASFYSISGSDFVELYVGVGASRVRTLFKEARENAPSLVFIDELDSVGRARSGPGAMAQGEQEQALNQILTEMDGFSPSEGIIVIGATNRADVLDPALLRPGRFDRTIGLALPDEKARLGILSMHAAKRTMGPGVDLGAIAHESIGLSGADLANVVNEAALLAIRAGKAAVTQEELAEALHRTLEAPERQRRLSQRAKSIAKRFTQKERITFADVAGQDGAVAQLREIRDYLAHPERFLAIGSDIPKGVLLYGPPGCGKTLLARALACEANAAFFSVGASEFIGMFSGTGASRVSDLFAEARSMAPTIVFIDELDSIGQSRGGAGQRQGSQGSEQEQALNQMLAEMDGFSTKEGVLVLAATNRPDVLDPALLRPGRFDRTIGLELPAEKGRLDILSLHAAAKKLAPDVDLGEIARRAIGLTGADLAGLMNEAGILAVREGKDAISQAELDAALHHLLSAPGDQRRLAMRGRSIGKRSAPMERVTFAEVAGVDDAITELAEVKDYLADPARFARLGARAPRGILLSGPPGCGKTLLARAVAGEANAAFFSVAGSEFVEVFVGEGAARVRDLFGEAKSMAPSIVFVDEIDAIGGHRSSTAGGGREAEQTLNQILVELDGFEPNNAVIVMAATNRPDMLDTALVRPGRFDRHVSITLPDRAGRRAILELCAKRLPLGHDVDLDAVAGLTRGFSGADLAGVVNEAALLAGRRGHEMVSMALVEEGMDRAMMGLASRTTMMSDDERQLVAFHEAGHALVALALPGTAPPHKLTIVPRGGSLGHCRMLDTHDRVVARRSMLMGELAVHLGGMVAEEICYGEVSSSTSGDLQRVGQIARQMVRDYGMNESLGPIAYPDEIGSDGRPRRTYSEDSARTIDTEVRLLVDKARHHAHQVLSEHRDALERVARALLERETLTAGEVAELAQFPAAPGIPRTVAAAQPVVLARP